MRAMCHQHCPDAIDERGCVADCVLNAMFYSHCTALVNFVEHCIHYVREIWSRFCHWQTEDLGYHASISFCMVVRWIKNGAQAVHELPS